MQYAGRNYRNEIIEAIEDGALSDREALLECLCYMSMDDARRVYEALGFRIDESLDDGTFNVYEEPIVPKYLASEEC
jgi:hypothetical protein